MESQKKRIYNPKKNGKSKKKTELTNTNNNTEESAEGLRIFSKSPD